MRRTSNSYQVDALQVLGVCCALVVSSLLLLVAVLSGVSLETALVRAGFAWVALSLLGIGVALIVRWALTAPSPRRHQPSLDVTLPATDLERGA